MRRHALLILVTTIGYLAAANVQSQVAEESAPKIGVSPLTAADPAIDDQRVHENTNPAFTTAGMALGRQSPQSRTDPRHSHFGDCPASNCFAGIMTQSTNMDIVPGTGEACMAGGNTTPNAWARCFNPVEEGWHDEGGGAVTMTIESVDFGFETEPPADTGPIPIFVNVYLDLDGCPANGFGTGNIVLLGTAETVVSPGDAGILLNAAFAPPLLVELPAGAGLIVEFENLLDGTDPDNGVGLFGLWPGSNVEDQCGVHYWRAAACGLPDWTDCGPWCGKIGYLVLLVHASRCDGGEVSCGDGACDEAENCASCPADCGTCSLCGDGVCSDNEDCEGCEPDCGPCPNCGDASCSANEDCESCEADCGPCPPCGDTLCTEPEDCANCEEDCGPCPVCGDGIRQDAEDCDGGDDENCAVPGSCQADCTCVLAGACCDPDGKMGGCDSNLTQSDCEDAGGTWLGGGTDCILCACLTAEHQCIDGSSGGVGCSDFQCCVLVCEIDPFCCDSEWNIDCVDHALNNCEDTCGNGRCGPLENCGICPADCATCGGCPASNCSSGILSQSTSMAIVPGTGIACAVGEDTTPNAWARCFNPIAEGWSGEGDGSVTLGIESVEFGFETEPPADTGPIPIFVNVYIDFNGCPADGFGTPSIFLLGTAETVVSPGDAGVLLSAVFQPPLKIELPPGAALIVEFENLLDGTDPDNRVGLFGLWPGSNTLGQCGPSYIRAADCGFADWAPDLEQRFPLGPSSPYF